MKSYFIRLLEVEGGAGLALAPAPTKVFSEALSDGVRVGVRLPVDIEAP